ncbi:MAG TPA: peptidylprolyl isomerase, partial [Rhodothermales bacterium]
LAREFVRYYDQTFIEERIPEATEESLRDFYRANRDSLFHQLERVNTEIIVRSDEGEIRDIWERAKAGVPFESLSHRRLLRSYERTRSGDIVTRLSQEPPYLGAVAFGLGEGEISEPVAYEDSLEGRLFAIVKATKRLEERQLTFEEVADRLPEIFRDFHRKQTSAEVERELWGRYTVRIHRDVVEAMLVGSNVSASKDADRASVGRRGADTRFSSARASQR